MKYLFFLFSRFFASEEYRTGQPKAGRIFPKYNDIIQGNILDSFPEKPLRINNEKIKLNDPFPLSEWIDKHKEEFSHGSLISLFPDQFQTRAYVISKGHHMIDCSTGDVWLWQHVSYYIIVSKNEFFFLY